MHVLALVNQKGGCGKTTTAVNLAGALAVRGQRVLLIDLDPQAHATLALGWAIEQEPSLLDVLLDRLPLEEADLEVPGGFRLVPATDELAEFEEVSARMVRPEQVLRAALQGVSTSYDFAILDCPPRVDGVLSANALRAADTAILIVECGAFALQGALKTIRVLEEQAEGMDHPFSTRVLGTLLDRRTRFARDLLTGMQARFGPLLFETAIRTNVRLREAAAHGVPVQVLDPSGRAAANFAYLAEEVVAHAHDVALTSARRGRNLPAVSIIPQVASRSPRPARQ